jgi:hypothetical protein
VIALVVTTVHPADDPRIRERTVRSLAHEFDVRYAARPPAPSAPGDHEWIPLEGNRPVRWLRALAQMTRGDVAVVSLHDPELIPAGLIARLLRGVPVVVDVHEDVPSAIRQREWIPSWLRPSLAWAAARLLRLAERFCTVTLAEPGYRRLFQDDHAVFPNYPAERSLPDPAADQGFIVYVGDITGARGATDMVEAVARLDPARPLVMIGRCPEDLADLLRARADAAGVALEVTGWMRHGEAMARAAGASAGLSLLRDPHQGRRVPGTRDPRGGDRPAGDASGGRRSRRGSLRAGAGPFGGRRRAGLRGR